MHLIQTIRFSWECDSKSGSILFLCRCKQKISHLNAWVNSPSFRKNSMLLFCLLLRKYVLLQIVSSSRKKSDWSNSKRLKHTRLLKILSTFSQARTHYQLLKESFLQKPMVSKLRIEGALLVLMYRRIGRYILQICNKVSSQAWLSYFCITSQ